MTNEKLAKSILLELECGYISYGNLHGNNEQGLNLIKGTIEKQIPKKPNAYHTRFFGDDRMAYDCPNCKHCFTMMKPNYNDSIARNQYCDICGQAIDWSEVN